MPVNVTPLKPVYTILPTNKQFINKKKCQWRNTYTDLLTTWPQKYFNMYVKLNVNTYLKLTTIL